MTCSGRFSSLALIALGAFSLFAIDAVAGAASVERLLLTISLLGGLLGVVVVMGVDAARELRLCRVAAWLELWSALLAVRLF